MSLGPVTGTSACFGLTEIGKSTLRCIVLGSQPPSQQQHTLSHRSVFRQKPSFLQMNFTRSSSNFAHHKTHIYTKTKINNHGLKATHSLSLSRSLSTSNSFLLLLVRHLFLVAWHLFLIASCSLSLRTPEHAGTRGGLCVRELLGAAGRRALLRGFSQLRLSTLPQGTAGV